MAIFEKINAIWQRLPIVQKSLLFAIIIACGAVAFLLWQWATKPDMRLLYSNLEPDEAAKIVEKVADKEINYQLKSGGTSIYVPRENVHQLRLEMAKDGLPTNKQEGYKIFEKTKVGTSPTVQQINTRRALEEELAKTIQLINGVEFAKIHLVLPEQTMFTNTAEEAKGSVMIKMRPGWRLNPGSIAAMTHLVAGAVDGLEADKVTIMDSQGSMLTNGETNNTVVGGANTALDYKERVQIAIENRVQGLLDTVLGPGKSSVKVNAEVEMVSLETVKTEYDEGIKTEEIVDETSKVKPLQFTKDDEGENATPSEETEKGSTIETKLKVPETITKTVKVPGNILSLSVAAVVDLSMPSVQEETGEEEETEEGGEVATEQSLTQAKIMTIDQVKDVIRQAVGPKLLLDESGKEALTVIEAKFPARKVDISAASSVGGWEKILQLVRNSSMGILSICAIVVLWIITRASKQEPAEKKQVGAASDFAALLPGASGDEEPAVAMRQHIAARLRENPQEVKQLFNNWLEESL
jgi:flagellar M-ring protein FliF